MLFLLKKITIEGQKNSVATAACYCEDSYWISIGVAVVAGSVSDMGLKSEEMPSAMYNFEQLVCSAFVQ